MSQFNDNQVSKLIDSSSKLCIYEICNTSLAAMLSLSITLYKRPFTWATYQVNECSSVHMQP